MFFSRALMLCRYALADRIYSLSVYKQLDLLPFSR